MCHSIFVRVTLHNQMWMNIILINIIIRCIYNKISLLLQYCNYCNWRNDSMAVVKASPRAGFEYLACRKRKRGWQNHFKGIYFSLMLFILKLVDYIYIFKNKPRAILQRDYKHSCINGNTRWRHTMQCNASSYKCQWCCVHANSITIYF